MLLFIADWKKIGEHRQQLTDLNTTQENKGRIDYDNQAGQKVLVWNEGILCKAESRYLKESPHHPLDNTVTVRL
jgi:hypothetical protein